MLLTAPSPQVLKNRLRGILKQGVREPDSAAHAGSPEPAVSFGIEQAPNNRKSRRKGEREKAGKEKGKERERDWGTEGRTEGMKKEDLD